MKDFVMGFDETTAFISKMTALFSELHSKYRREGKYHLRIAVGCTGGKHRSVVIASELAERLKAKNLTVELSHRELARGR